MNSKKTSSWKEQFIAGAEERAKVLQDAFTALAHGKITAEEMNEAVTLADSKFINNIRVQIKGIARMLKNVLVDMLDDINYDALKEIQVKLIKDVEKLDFIGNVLADAINDK